MILHSILFYPRTFQVQQEMGSLMVWGYLKSLRTWCGSGFSFADLAADRAGRKFAQLAIDPSRARNLQQQIISATNENDFMPSIESLPEGIQELEFKARFASLGSDEYRVIENEIERRLKACRAYRG
ncbi:MAG: hypothetical protein R3E74_03240 [Pseudomonadales bacterium]